MTPEYQVAAEALADIRLGDLSGFLASTPRIVAHSVTIEQLATLTDYPTGVYLFYRPDSDSLQYVGKATSRSFIDRIPAHFDPREAAWMNSLPKHVMKHESCTYDEALRRALALELTLIGASNDLPGGRIEAVLRGYLKPALNATKRDFADDLSLAAACGLCV